MFGFITAIFRRNQAEESRRERPDDQYVVTVRGIDGSPIRGDALVAWMAHHLAFEISAAVNAVASALGERTLQVPLAHLCVGPKRIGTWQQSWKVVSSSSVTFQVTLMVEDRDPTLLLMRMTSYPSLVFPPLEARLTDLIRRHAGVEILRATTDIANLEVRGRAYSIRPHLVWNPSRKPALTRAPVTGLIHTPLPVLAPR